VSDATRGLRIASARIGSGEYAGVCFTAIPLVIEAPTPEEAIAKAAAVAAEVRELLEAHDGVRMAKGTQESILALEIALQVARADVRRRASRQ
jgi:hypothetical protein